MKSKYLFGFLYLLSFFLFSIYSYAHTDPNLVLSNWDPYWNFQQQMWQLGYHQRPLSTLIYFILIVSLFIIYYFILKQISNKQLTFKQGIFLVISAVCILLFAYPALSHDIFNYLFNSKMVWFYRANPHLKVALDFPQDPWLKFMHNTHTPAPYAYGWTIVSLLPSYLGQHHLKFSLILFKLFVVFWFGLLIFLQQKIGRLVNQPKLKFFILVFALNPLVLIETVANGHNDVVMMALALLSSLFFLKALKLKKFSLFIPSLIFLLASISIKYATIALIGSLVIYFIIQKLKTKWSFGDISAIAISSPLLTNRSQRFLPWYLIWPLSFIPLINQSLITEVLLIFSFSSLMRYLPYLYHGDYSALVIKQRLLITFLPPIIYLLTRLFLKVIPVKIKS